MHVGLTIDILDTEGKKTGTMTLPEAVFGAKVNKTLITQAIRVYMVNQRRGTVATQSRGEVSLTTAKWYRQKGTGRARHGAKSAPIFVKGGVAHGPKQRDYALRLPTKMKAVAFSSALSAQLKDNAVTVVAGIAELGQKTKAFAGMFEKLGMGSKGRNILLVLPKHTEAIFKSARNLVGVDITTAQQLNTHDIVAHKKLVFMKEAIAALTKENK